jgi:manganese/iron transport system permease protein/iron/zinc/copper transport system permease protein
MNSTYQWFVEIHQANPYLIKALLTGLLVTTVCSVIGCYIVLRRTSFLADALSHSMLAGVVAGYLVMKVLFNEEAHALGMLVGSIASGIFTVAVIGFVSRKSRVKDDAVIGVMYTGIFALGGVLASRFSEYVHVDVYHFVIGSILGVSDSDLRMMAVVTIVVLTFVILAFRQLQLISFDRVMAASIGVNVVLLDYMLTTCTAMVVVTGVQVVGIIQVVGLLIAPGATAYLLCDRLKNMIWVAILFGWSGFLIGYYLSEQLNVSPGGMIVVVCTVQFLLVFLVAPRYGLLAGWQRRWRAIPQQLIEDILGVIMRSDDEQATIAEISQRIEYRVDRIRKAIQSLARQEMLLVDDDIISFTDEGRQQARRLLRAHRLWESYLQHLGVAEEELHDRAHVLEHVHDEDTVDYLDDKLGHPLFDPHGAEIPEDFVHLVPGEEVRVAILREDHRGEIVRVIGGNTGGLEVGMQIIVGPREDNSQMWVITVIDQDSTQGVVRLNHAQADSVIVKLQASD